MKFTPVGNPTFWLLAIAYAFGAVAVGSVVIVICLVAGLL